MRQGVNPLVTGALTFTRTHEARRRDGNSFLGGQEGHARTNTETEQDRTGQGRAGQGYMWDSRCVKYRVSYRGSSPPPYTSHQQMGWEEQAGERANERMNERGRGDRVPGWLAGPLGCGLGGRCKGGRCVPAERREYAECRCASCNSWDTMGPFFAIFFFIYQCCMIGQARRMAAFALRHNISGFFLDSPSLD